MNRENYVEPMVADSKGNLYVSMKYHKENIEDLQRENEHYKYIIEQELRIEIDRLNIRLLQLNDEIESYCEIKNDLQQRIDKAIEYLEKYTEEIEGITCNYYTIPDTEDLLEILKGDVSNE